jgi:hypothetical protein
MTRFSRPLVFFTFAAVAFAQDFAGTWTYTQDGQTAALRIEQNASGRIAGTLSMGGVDLPLSGHVEKSSLEIDSLAGQPMTGRGARMTGRLEAGFLVVEIVNPGEDAVKMRMSRLAAGAAPIQQGAPPRTSSARFDGDWEAVNDDNTEMEVAEISVTGNSLSGTLQVRERGYFSGRVTVKGTARFRGEIRGSSASLRVWNAEQGEAASVDGTAELRGEYLVLRTGGSESVLARPGVPLVKSAEGSAEAAALARAVTGRVFLSSSQASGRDGALVGAHTKLALCSDGTISYDNSKVATTGSMPGGAVDMGDTIIRRGTWTIVLRGGRPVVRAQWRGTGSSYSLTGYFEIEVSPDSQSAVVNGTRLQASGGC